MVIHLALGFFQAMILPMVCGTGGIRSLAFRRQRAHFGQQFAGILMAGEHETERHLDRTEDFGGGVPPAATDPFVRGKGTGRCLLE